MALKLRAQCFSYSKTNKHPTTKQNKPTKQNKNQKLKEALTTNIRKTLPRLRGRAGDMPDLGTTAFPHM